MRAGDKQVKARSERQDVWAYLSFALLPDFIGKADTVVKPIIAGLSVSLCLSLLGCKAPASTEVAAKGSVRENQTSDAPHRTPFEIVDQAPASDWRGLDLENTLYLELDHGTVVMELSPLFAPGHVTNTKALVRAGVFDQTNFYRVIDGFVAQGGPADPSLIAVPEKGALSIPGEMTLTTETPLDFVPMTRSDGYAHETGFVGGFAAGRNADKTTSWLLHCYGALGMGRANEEDSGGTELYIVNGPAQRYLDRNTTVFGRVIAGMEHIQALERSSGPDGERDMSGKNIIRSIKVASDMSEYALMPLQVMKTDTESFRDFINSRINRRGEWFIYQADYMDACGLPMPVRLAPNQPD